MTPIFSKCLPLVALCVLLLQACSVPHLNPRVANAAIPGSYTVAAVDTASAVAAVRWNDFFTDPRLVGLIDTAMINNREVNILLQTISRARNEIQARKGEYLPFVSAGVSPEVEKVGRYTRNGAIEDNLRISEDEDFPEFLPNIEFGLYASWELDVWHKLRNARKVAVLEYLGTVEGRNFVITNLVAEIANSYYELEALDNELQNLQNNLLIQEDALRVVNLLQRAGRSNSLAVKRFEAEIQKNQSDTYRIQQEITTTENRLNLLLGRAPAPIARQSANFLETEPAVLQTGVPSQLLTNRPDIRRAELEISAANLNIDVARANFLPSFGIRAGAGYQSFNFKHLLASPESMLFSLAGDVMAPIVNRNAIEAEYGNAGARQVQAVYEYEQSVLRAYQEVSTELSNIDNLQNTYRLKQQQVNSLDESIEISKQLYQSARADYMEVLLTQRDALEARTELIETRQAQMSAVANLYRALGGGWQ